MIDIMKSVLLGLIEGLTEFVPVSSTGHLIVATDLLGIRQPLAATLAISIQFGAVLALVWFYRRDLWTQTQAVRRDRATQRFWLLLLIAAVPAGVLGLIWHEWITATLFTPATVGVALVLGGLVLIVVERRPLRLRTHGLVSIGWRQAAAIGLMQATALVPGVSRSAATLMGGLLVGLDRPTATVFSFWLALPTLGAATLFELATSMGGLTPHDVLLVLVGLLAAFASALVVVGWLLRYVARHTFRPFGYYRIVAGAALLLWSLLRLR